MKKFCLTAIVVLLSCFSFFAQGIEPVQAPADVVLNFDTESGGREFHLGELISIKYSYLATTPGKYTRVEQSQKLTAGRSLDIRCTPPSEAVRRVSLSWTVTDDKFGNMLVAPCGGIGGASVGDCFDCDSELPLSKTPVNFRSVPMNNYVRFRVAGSYTCVASSADVTTNFKDEKVRYALRVNSKPLELRIVDDPAWSRSAAAAYASAYDRSCRSKSVPHENLSECYDLARRITYLDSLDSLATEVARFDGRDHGWNNGFWESIQHTSYPVDAVQLMTTRMQESDFEVSRSTIEWLASSELKIESPEAFEPNSPAVRYHRQAIDKLRKFVRLLGASVATKEPRVARESAKTYSFFAKQEYCEGKPLIPQQEQDLTLSSIKSASNQ